MIQAIRHIFIFALLLGFFSPVFLHAQNEGKSKSRLSIQRTAQRVNLPILLAKRSFHVNPALQTNLDLKQNSYLTQIMKSSFAKASTTNIVGQNQDRKLVEENSNNPITYSSMIVFKFRMPILIQRVIFWILIIKL
jgi:hypothetical protein